MIIHKKKKKIQIPEKYILRQWRKDVKRCHAKVKIGYVDWKFKYELHRFNNKCNLFYEFADSVANIDKKYNMVTAMINDTKINLNKVIF